MSVIWVTSGVLGLACGALNPMGIRWSEIAQLGPPAKLAVESSHPLRATAGASNSTIPIAVSMVEKSNSSAAVLTNAAPAPATGYSAPTPASWAEIKPLYAQGQVVLVDARARAFYDAGHIPGAVSLPEPPSAEAWAAFRQAYPANIPLVVYCGSTSCSLSYKLANRLAKESGYEFVRFITGGYQAWLGEGTLANAGDTATAATSGRSNPPIPPPVAANPNGPKMDNALPITWAQTRPLLAIRQAVLLDARSQEEYNLGHIPGALSLPADSPPATIRQALAQRDCSTRLVAYCGAMGCTEAFQLATRLMREWDFPNAQFLREGYADWRRAQTTDPSREGAGR